MSKSLSWIILNDHRNDWKKTYPWSIFLQLECAGSAVILLKTFIETFLFEDLKDCPLSTSWQVGIIADPGPTLFVEIAILHISLWKNFSTLDKGTNEQRESFLWRYFSACWGERELWTPNSSVCSQAFRTSLSLKLLGLNISPLLPLPRPSTLFIVSACIQWQAL